MTGKGETKKCHLRPSIYKHVMIIHNNASLTLKGFVDKNRKPNGLQSLTTLLRTRWKPAA
jgi:hypothetical protein